MYVGTVPSHESYRDGTVPSCKKHHDDTVPAHKRHHDGTVALRKKHHDVTAENQTSNFLMTHIIQISFHGEKIIYFCSSAKKSAYSVKYTSSARSTFCSKYKDEESGILYVGDCQRILTSTVNSLPQLPLFLRSSSFLRSSLF